MSLTLQLVERLVDRQPLRAVGLTEMLWPLRDTLDEPIAAVLSKLVEVSGLRFRQPSRAPHFRGFAVDRIEGLRSGYEASGGYACVAVEWFDPDFDPHKRLLICRFYPKRGHVVVELSNRSKYLSKIEINVLRKGERVVVMTEVEEKKLW